jgi:hypothetical protein
MSGSVSEYYYPLGLFEYQLDDQTIGYPFGAPVGLATKYPSQPPRSPSPNRSYSSSTRSYSGMTTEEAHALLRQDLAND